MPKLVLAASLMAALVLAACGSSTPAPSQPAVSAPPASPTPSVPADVSSPDPSGQPAVTPAPTAIPTTQPTPRPTPRPVVFSKAERYLIDGIMRGESECSPVRGGNLPGLAIAGIDCKLIGSPVARAGYYLYANTDDLLDAYMARVSVQNLIVESGACTPGEGEGAYTPWADNELAPSRHACYVNDQGYGNYRATLPGFHVYVGLLGRTADMKSLEDWAWFGNEDTPGSPTLWQQSFVYRP